MLRVRVSTVVLVVTASVGVAQAADRPVTIFNGDTDNQRRAKVVWNEGLERLNLVDDPSDPRLDEAIAKFKEAYEYYPYVNLLQALGQAYRQKNDHRRAALYFKRYLNEYRRLNGHDADDRAGFEALIVEQEQLAAKQEDSAKIPPNEAKGPSTEAGEPAPAQLVPRVTPVPDGPAWYHDRWAWTVTASGVVAAAVGGAFLYAAHEKEASLADADERRRIELRREADLDNRIGVTALVGGGLVGVVGVAMLIYNPRPASPRLEVTTGVSSVSVGFRVAF